ncbi:MAG TPA: HTH domain-containing protein, partial [Oscillospiraceae bacterium]|nr:HTH domain-containing protein [Oscillospiraceae bacterium]
MSKLSNTLKMLILLKSRGKMTLQEIADELEVSKRQVIRYREDLDKAGIFVTSIPGRYGGYALDGKDYILGLNVTDEEYLTLISAQEHLKYENFIGYRELKILVDKIGALKENENNMDLDFYIKNTKP